MCPSRYNSIRKPLSSHAASLAFEGELSSGAASVLRVSVQQFRAVLPSSSGAAPRPSSTAGYDLLASCSCLLPLSATGATCQPDQPARAPTRRTPHPYDACAAYVAGSTPSDALRRKNSCYLVIKSGDELGGRPPMHFRFQIRGNIRYDRGDNQRTVLCYNYCLFTYLMHLLGA